MQVTRDKAERIIADAYRHTGEWSFKRHGPHYRVPVRMSVSFAPQAIAQTEFQCVKCVEFRLEPNAIVGSYAGYEMSCPA